MSTTLSPTKLQNQIEAGSPVVLDAAVSQEFSPPVGRLLDSFSLQCRAKEITVVLGASGSGKTTLLKRLAESCGARSKVDNNIKVAIAPDKYAFVFQSPELVPWRNVKGNAQYEAELIDNLSKEQIDKRTEKWLSEVGLAEAQLLFPHELSAGMRQRVQLVRAINRSVKLIFLDEPLGAVDQPQRLAIASRLRSHFHSAECAVIWVTHDLLEALTVGDRIVVVGKRPLEIVRDIRIADEDRPVANEKNTSLISSLFSDLASEENLRPTQKQTHLISNNFRRWSWPTRQQLISLMILGTVLIGLAFFWELLILAKPRLSFFIPAPHAWLSDLLKRIATTDFLSHVTVTVREAFLGLAIAFGIGTALGYVSGLFDVLGRSVRPLFVGLTAVPLFVLAPAFIIWFGIGEPMKIALASCSAIPFVALAVLDAVRASRSPFHAYLYRNGVRLLPLFFHHTFPHTLAAWFTGLRAAGIAALLGAFLGEFISAERGLGYLILFDAGRYRIGDAIGGITVLFIVAILLDGAFRALGSLQNRVLFKLKL